VARDEGGRIDGGQLDDARLAHQTSARDELPIPVVGIAPVRPVDLVEGGEEEAARREDLRQLWVTEELHRGLLEEDEVGPMILDSPLDGGGHRSQPLRALDVVGQHGQLGPQPFQAVRDLCER